MDFLSTGEFWVFFSLIAVVSIVFEFSYNGKDVLSHAISNICEAAMIILVILAFVFMWWQGGLAILVSLILWLTFNAFTFGRFLR